MAENKVCPQGHQWEASSQDSCPQCDAHAETVTQGSFLPPPPPPELPTRATASPPSALPRPTISDFEIVAELGHGGMGVVYKARQVSLKRLVALKMILAGAQAHPNLLARFRQEAEAVARLQHPHIVQIFAIGEQNGCPYLALEYVDGGSLDQRLNHQPQSGRIAAQLVEQLARAVHYAHQHGVVHRDLKPANILLQKQEAGGAAQGAGVRGQEALLPLSFVAKISDFGLAKQLDTDSGQTQSGAILGTPSYMAPEQAAGNPQAVGPPADVYALGAILYELLTGQPPFRAATPIETIQQVLTREVTPPSKLVTRVHRDLETICLKALAKEPGRRYASALELAEDLARFQAGDAILARRDSLARRVWRKARRNPVVLIAATVVVLALTVAGYFALRVSSAARQVTFLTQRLDDELYAAELTEAFLERNEATIDELESLDEGQGSPLRQRLYQRYAEVFRQSLKNRTIRSEEVPRLEQALAPLAARAPDLSRELTDSLKKRLGQWQPLVELAAPYKEWDAAFPADKVQLSKDKLSPRPPFRSNVQTVFSRVRTEGNTRLEVTFGDGWDKGHTVGLLLHAHGLASQQQLFAMLTSLDGRFLVTQSNWGNASLWDLSSESVRLTFPATLYLCPAIFSPDCKYLVGGTDTVRFWELETFQEKTLLRDAPKNPTALAFDQEGKVLAVGDNAGQVHFWDWSRKERLSTLQVHAVAVRAVRFLPDGKTVISLGHEKIAFAEDGLNLARIGHEASIKVWERADAKPPRVIFHDKILPGGLQVSPDGQTVALGYSSDNRIKLLDTATGTARSTGIRTAHRGGSAAFSPDGKVLALANGREILLCHPRTGQVQAVWTSPRMARAQALCFSADGSHVFAGDLEGKLYKWETASAKLRSVFGARSYAFLLRGAHRLGAADEFMDATPLEALRKKDPLYRLEIRRDGVLLREQHVEAGLLPAGPLRMQVSAEGRRLSFQINDLPVLSFEESMSYASEKPGMLALHWPVGVPLLRLRASQQLLPADTSPVENGDALYVHGRFADALASYEEQEILATVREVRQECRHKQGLCLAGLGREGEAATLLEKLGNETGSRWPALALCELWILRLRQNRLDEAETLFDTLRVRFPLDHLATLLAGESRSAIMAAYSGLAQGINFYRADPNRIRHLERGAKVEEFLYGKEQVEIRSRLARAYQAHGQIEEAFQLIQKMLGSAARYSPHLAWVTENGWLQRLRGNPKQGLEEVDRWLFSKPGTYRSGAEVLLVERARLHAALNQLEAAEKDLRDFFQVTEQSGPHHTAAAIMLGFLAERKGDAAAARKIWEKALLVPEETTPVYGFEFLYNMIQASLTDKLSDAAAEQFIARVARSVSGDESLIDVVTNTVRVPPAVLRGMWRTPRGKELARQIAFQEISFQEILRKPAVLLITEMVKHGATGDKISTDQDELLWKTFQDFYVAYEEGRLTASQVLPLALTWKGVSGTFGWAGIDAKLSPAIRGPFAYVFGHRYLRLKQEDQARRFFQTARDQAGDNALLRRLAEDELRRWTTQKTGK